MITAVGITLVSLSIVGFGLSYVNALKTEKESVLGLILLTERIRTRIKCFRQNLDEIFDGFTHPFLDATGFTDDLKNKGMSFALTNSGERLGIGRDIMLESEKFASELGKSYYDEQLTLCESYLTYLKTKYEGINEGLPTKTKLSISLSCAVSALTAILFL